MEMGSTGDEEACTLYSEIDIKEEPILTDPYEEPFEETKQIYFKEENVKLEIPDDVAAHYTLQLDEEPVDTSGDAETPVSGPGDCPSDSELPRPVTGHCGKRGPLAVGHCRCHISPVGPAQSYGAVMTGPGSSTSNGVSPTEERFKVPQLLNSDVTFFESQTRIKVSPFPMQEHQYSLGSEIIVPSAALVLPSKRRRLTMETGDTRNLSNSELQRLGLLYQLDVLKLKKKKLLQNE